MTHHAIIIGAGLGGLMAAAQLVKRQKKVLVLEQHYLPGGCATTFKRKGYNVEVGLHEIDGLGNTGEGIHAMLKSVGALEAVEFVRVPEFYRFKNNRRDLSVPDNMEQAIEVLIREFPTEEKGILKYFKKLKDIRRDLKQMPKAKWKTIFMPLTHRDLVLSMKQNLGNFLDKIIQNDDLKLILSANLGYYHDDPYTMALSFYAVAQSSYYTGGGHFIKGGSQQLSDYLMNYINTNGGQVLLQKKVDRIIIRDGIAVGVDYHDVRHPEEEREQVYAQAIIANAAIPNVINELLDEKTAEPIAQKTKNLTLPTSILSIYIGFKRTPKALGHRHYSTFYNASDVYTLSDIKPNTLEPFENRSFVFVDYSQIDSGLAPDGKGFGVVCVPDKLAFWEHLSDEEYKAEKERVAQLFFNKLEQDIPGITEQIDYYEVATPKTIKRYTLNPEGVVYGYAQTPEQSFMKRPPIQSGVPRLYFASAWTMPGGGFSGAMYAGALCAKKAYKHMETDLMKP